MFTGIVTHQGTVGTVVDDGGDRRFDIEAPWSADEVALGASICCSGACMTVTERWNGGFRVSASAETLARTTLGAWTTGTRINLERSLRLGDELGGHLVFGHVDAVAEVALVEDRGDSHWIEVVIPDDLCRFVAEKGSVALDGVSLTVNGVDDNRFSVNIIPHTWTCTTLQKSNPGHRLNFEIDMLARYVDRMVTHN